MVFEVLLVHHLPTTVLCICNQLTIRKVPIDRLRGCVFSERAEDWKVPPGRFDISQRELLNSQQTVTSLADRAESPSAFTEKL